MNFNPGWKFTCNVPPSGQHGLLYNYFFQHHSELNTPMISTNIFFRKHDGIKIFNDQASSSEAVARKCSVKKCSQTFRKTVSRKSVSDLDTGPFLSILQNFQEHFCYWTPPVVAFSNFKVPGFTEAVMQMNFWITHDLAHLSILSSSWHFCVYFRQAQAFRCIPTASLTLDILYSFDKEG